MVLYVPRPLDRRRRRESARDRDEPDHVGEGLRQVASKAQSLRWLEGIRRSQRLTDREERRKEEILGIFRELYGISSRRFDPPDFPPWRSPW